MLRVDDLDKYYGDRQILDSVNLEVRKGETVAIVGSSGSGKSTLLRCMGLLEPFDGGSVSLRGSVIAKGSESRRHERKADARRRTSFGFVFQNFNLINNRTALENVMEGPVIVKGMTEDAARKRAVEVLERVGVGHRVNASVPEMSGGEQQRVAIARSLAMSPQCLLLDEPTSALDPELVGEVLDVVSELAREGVTMAIVTHEMGFAYGAADRLVFLKEGRVWEEGAAQQTLRTPRTPELATFLRRFHYSSMPVQDGAGLARAQDGRATPPDGVDRPAARSGTSPLGEVGVSDLCLVPTTEGSTRD
ncbi:amino acid ABC transporter ATP-binding protein [Xylanimonas allomyrinae]|uniref:Amino acid ABC transporter ATP-binding protein n=1 Tax=Xylanimonas allomyrinae TaxID=2509459 RepID=A0A4P6EPI2_9MICO|nr:amino acid ABC transporter ATP-binding protein [Xylanimonas allomyrinae]